MHLETHPVKSKVTRLWLASRFYKDNGRPPATQALQEALEMLEAKALFEGEEHEVHVRTAEHEGAIYVDFANGAWEVAKITPERVEVVSDPPVRFKRRNGMLGLPRPIEGGDINVLRRFVNVGDEDDWKLLIAWLVQAFRPTGPYPILVLQGEQGSAKTTTARMLRAITDPSSTPVRTPPRGEHDLMIAASGSWVVTMDNLSGLSPWLSDALCRLSTGGGFGTRTLYENDEETLFDATRPVILNGITEVATRADLLDRAIILTLPRIPEEERKAESELWEEFERALPCILGGLLEAVSGALRNLPDTELPRLPRMADFALWATAAEDALGWEKESFMEAYTGSRKEINELALESDPVAVAVRKLMESRDEWVGSPTELWKKLGDATDEEVRRTKAWPKAPNALSAHLKRLAPILRAVGIEIEDDRDARTGDRKKRLSKKGPLGNPTRQNDEKARTLSAPASEANEESKSASSEVPEDAASPDGPDDGDDNMHTHSKWELVGADEDLQALIPKIEGAEPVAVDLETTGLNPRTDKARLISLSTAEGSWLVDCFRVNPAPLFPILAEKKLVFHNAIFDLGFLTNMGFELGNGEVIDTMLMSQVTENYDPTESEVAA